MTVELIDRYNIPGPRYTSYPTVPFWEGLMDQATWRDSCLRSFHGGGDEGISLYIHLPYCESLCTFCGCHKHITKRHEVERPYIDTLLKEWQLYLELFPKQPVIKEVHLGGGTPTFFAPDELERLLLGIFGTSSLHHDLELGFEGHPNNTTGAHLRTLYNLGARRVSFGVQDYNEKVQRTINRIQPFASVQRVHEQAVSLGYTSISHDLVFGLPHQTKGMVLDTIRLTNRLRPDRISLYSYAHVPWVKGVGQLGFDERDLPQDVEKRALYVAAKEALEHAGYHEVGMDHFALETDSLYRAFANGELHRNFMGYTTNSTQLMVGLGMSAIGDSWYGFAQNAKSVKVYMELVEEGVLPIFRGHELTDEDLEVRGYILDLMCRFQTSWTEEFELRNGAAIRARLKAPIRDGLCQVKGRTLNVTELGKAFVRNICMAFDLHLARNTRRDRMFSKTV